MHDIARDAVTDGEVTSDGDCAPADSHPTRGVLPYHTYSTHSAHTAQGTFGGVMGIAVGPRNALSLALSLRLFEPAVAALAGQR